MNRKERKQLLRFGISVKQAQELEQYRRNLMQEACSAEGTEARKKIKQLMTVDCTPKLGAPRELTARA
ncbi:hypothetical protein [Proteus phage vB_PmiP_RS8pmA]|uniref:Uncharacterized protein n=1 Tax=Proteus phage vB_PmiP_RS8pmA TaxID=2250314 RepID=A0A514CY59_9CAUD|nr:hypothetical protein [Proteus phage vB_PmiP_RS8pmA]